MFFKKSVILCYVLGSLSCTLADQEQYLRRAADDCSVLPKFEGEWEPYQTYPLTVAESQGALVGNWFLQVSGYWKTYSAVTKQVFALDMTDPINNKWKEMPPLPFPQGLTHVATTKNGNKMYQCGGYVGPLKGPSTEKCFVFDMEKTNGTQWSALPDLPAPRGGGAMWYDAPSNSLIFAAGATRPISTSVTDHPDTWQLSLANVSAGWITKAPSPFKGNHVGFTTVIYQGTPRHYILGGQFEDNESTGNKDEVYEYVPGTNTWIQREKLPFKRGHFSESTLPYKTCGFFVIAGSVNGKPGATAHYRTDDISYYDITTNKWTSIGKYPTKQATPVCKVFNGYVYCQTGPVNKQFSVRRKIT